MQNWNPIARIAILAVATIVGSTVGYFLAIGLDAILPR